MWSMAWMIPLLVIWEALSYWRRRGAREELTILAALTWLRKLMLMPFKPNPTRRRWSSPPRADSFKIVGIVWLIINLPAGYQPGTT